VPGYPKKQGCFRKPVLSLSVPQATEGQW
jgi:hypothetical protein